jgi:GWxTD domain-containing protein
LLKGRIFSKSLHYRRFLLIFFAKSCKHTHEMSISAPSMVRAVLIVISLAILGAIPTYASDPTVDPTRYYELGKEKHTAGDWQEALRIWMTAITDSNFVDPDPRLGISFIELITEKELKNMYKSASLLYLWGMTADEIKPFATELEQEVERIKPLLTEDRYREWRNKLRAEDASLYADIRAFWLSVDPTPMQQPNERLLEHWERIAYARKNFTKNFSSAYGTDDRGLIYIRYGKPDRQHGGFLMPEDTEVRSKLVELNAMTTEIRQQGLETIFAQQQQNAMRAMFQPSEYEVWIYNLIDRKGTGTFIFGTPGDGGRFGLRRSMDEFIPRNAFRTPIQSPGSDNYNQMVAGNLIELGIYRDLAAVDPYFASTFVDLERTWSQYTSGAVSAESYKNISMNTTAANRLRDNQSLLNQSRSDFEKKYAPLDNTINIYRVLNNNEPAYIIVNKTDPSLATAVDARQMNNSETSRSYALRDAIAVFDENWKVLSYIEENPTLRLESSTMVVHADNSTFLVPDNINTVKNIRFSSELYRLGTQQMFRSDENAVVIGASNIELSLPTPLKPNTFEVSDIMLVDPIIESPGTRTEYKILPGNSIRPRGSLGMYFEVYNVPENLEGYRDYTVRYTITEPSRIRRNGRQRVQISASFRSDGQTGSEMLEIDTSKLKSGSYTCRLDFEASNGDKIVREFNFTVAN